MKWLSHLVESLTRVLNGISPDCRQASRMQSEAVHRRLSILERLGLRVHLLLCSWCRRYGHQVSVLRLLARNCEEEAPQPAEQLLTPEARERIRRGLR